MAHRGQGFMVDFSGALNWESELEFPGAAYTILQAVPSESLKAASMKNPRSFLLIGLALLLSPSACAQMVCDLNCSLQSESEKHSGGTHCDEEALAAASPASQGPGPARTLKSACHGKGCASDLGSTVSGASKITPPSVLGFATRSIESAFLPGDQRASRRFSLIERAAIGLGALSLASVLRI